MPELEAEDFLDLLWGEREGWVDLPAKVGKYWVPYPLEWPPSRDTIVSGRIDQSLRDEEDLYFSVAQFSKRGRSITDVLPVAWLWADLDEVHPSTATGLGFMPTIAVESSPGRYQAYWRLVKQHTPQVVEKLNRALTYALGADKGGWDLTQVLRIPSTRNFKYPGAPRVRIMWYDKGLVYKANDVWRSLKEHVPEEELIGVTTVTLPKKDIPRKALQLLWAKSDEVVEGERSDRLWELNCLLAESGLDENEIFKLVVHSVWNKWAGLRSGKERLRQDVRKAMIHVRRKAVMRERQRPRDADGMDESESSAGAINRDVGGGADSPTVRRDGSSADSPDADAERDGDSRGERLPFIGYSSFMAMAMEEPKWMIEDIWTAGSHGIIGGEPKTSKTTLALALGLSVASGQNFLGRYPVGSSGPVLMVQEENAPWMMQDRMRQLAVGMGLISKKKAHRLGRASRGALGREVHSVEMPGDIPLWILNNYGFDLSVEEHRDLLEGYVDEVRPVLVVLDPMYLVFGPINANEMGQLQPFLKWVIKLRYDYDCAVAIVHHMGKRTESNAGRRAGQRLIGSATLHGFTDSALYTSRLEDPREGWTKVLIEREFRAMEPQGPIEMAWHFDRPGSLNMQLEIAKQDLEGQIAEIVRQSEGVSVASLVKDLELDRRTILSRIRGGDLMVVEGSGRGKVQRVYMASSRNGDAASRV